MKRITINRISAWSAAKVGFAYYTAVGLVIGTVMGLANPNGLGYAVGAGIGYAIAGLIISPIVAWLYNFAAWLTGGLAIDVQESRIIKTTIRYEDEHAFTEK